MRTFWIAVGILAVIAAIMVWRSERAQSPANQSSAVAITDSSTPQSRTTTGDGGRSAANSALSPDDQTNQAVAPSSGSLRSPGSTAKVPPGMTSETDAATSATTSKSTSRSSEEQDLADELMNSSDENRETDIEDALNDGAGSDAGADAWQGEVVDGKYVIAGEGTAEAPYEITWDLLLLAAQTYQPRQGRTDIPPQLAAVNGKRITIAGYFTIPIASTDPKEVLFMLNMWDGCCIGMPPSPYDAIEVRLKTPLDGGNQFVNYATLTGTLTVDPFVQNGWLLGMYVMTDGELDLGM